MAINLLRRLIPFGPGHEQVIQAEATSRRRIIRLTLKKLCAQEKALMPHGKICYIEMPAKDAGASAEFYSQIFGWNVRTRGDGEIAFDDTTGAVSGTWVPSDHAATTRRC